MSHHFLTKQHKDLIVLVVLDCVAINNGMQLHHLPVYVNVEQVQRSCRPY